MVDHPTSPRRISNGRRRWCYEEEVSKVKNEGQLKEDKHQSNTSAGKKKEEECQSVINPLSQRLSRWRHHFIVRISLLRPLQSRRKRHHLFSLPSPPPRKRSAQGGGEGAIPSLPGGEGGALFVLANFGVMTLCGGRHQHAVQGCQCNTRAARSSFHVGPYFGNILGKMTKHSSQS